VQNCGINLDFDFFFTKEKWWTESTGCGPVVLSIHHGPAGKARPELAGGGVRRCSCARDLTVAAWGARGADGDPYPGSTSWWRGSDGQASVKGGGGGVSSTRGCKGEERRAKMSTVKMARGVAPFYRVRVAMEGSGGGRPARWVLIPIGF
jgi:hypothetical protein